MMQGPIYIRIILYYFNKLRCQPSPIINFKTLAQNAALPNVIKISSHCCCRNKTRLLSLPATPPPRHSISQHFTWLPAYLYQNDDWALPMCLDGSKRFWFLCNNNNRPYGHIVADTCYRREPISILDKFKWDLWKTKWHSVRFLSQYLGFPLLQSFHECFILIFILILLLPERNPMVSLEFFIGIILPAVVWSWVLLSLQQKWVPGIFPGW